MKTNRNVLNVHAHGPFLAAYGVLRQVGRWILQRTGGWEFMSLISDCLKQSRQHCGAPSRWIGGASLEEEGVAGVAHSDWFWRGGQRELIVGAAVTENLPTVPTVVLERERKTD